MPVAQSPEELIIRSEDEAWSVIESAASGHSFPDDIKIRFEGWPTFEVGYRGRDWHGTVPTRVMPPLLAVQKVISRAYAQVQYDEANLQRLHDDERDELELVVKVREGSSVFDAELWSQLSRIGEAAVGRMNGTEAVISVLGVALLIAAPVMYRTWVDKRKHEKSIEGEVERAKQETLRELERSKQDTERWRLMNETLQRNATLKTVHDDMQSASNKLLKATRSGDTVEMHDVTIPAEEAHILVQPDAERSRAVEYSGRFVVDVNRADKGAGFRVTIRRTHDGLVLTADVPAELPWDQQEAIRNAEWSKSPVELTVDAEVLGDKVTRATVLSASVVEP